MSDMNVEAYEEEPKKESGLMALLAGLLILLVSIGLYYNTADFELVYDDEHVILFNKNITSLKDDPSGFKRLFTQEFWAGAGEDATRLEALFRPKGQALYRPVFLSVLGFIYCGAQENPLPYHVANIIANAITCLMIFLLVRKLFSSTRLGFFTGLLFACHPIHTEAVAYVTGLGEVLAMLFFTLAILFYFKASYEAERFRFFPYLLSLVFYLVGLFTKENVITLLGIVVLYDVIMALQGRRPLGLIARVGMYAGYIVMTVANLAARYNVIGTLKPGEQAPIDNVIAAAQSYPVQLWTALKVLGKGIWLTIVPLDLSPDYSFAAITLSLKPLEAEVISAALFIVILLVIGFLSLKKRPVVAFGIFWHFITIAVVSNLVIIIGTIFGERLLYMPSLGFCLILAFALDRLYLVGAGTRIKAGAVAASVLLVGIAALGSWKTLEECKKWKDNERLFQAAVKVVPDSARVHYQLAQLYVQNKIYQEAEKEYMEVIRLDRSFIMAQMSLGDCYVLQQKYEQALKVYEGIKMQTPDAGNDNFNHILTTKMAQLYSMLQKSDQAIGELLVLKEKDNNPAINMQIGEHYLRQEDYDKAVEFYQEAWDLEPKRFDAAYKMLDIYRLKEDFVKEAELLERIEKEDLNSNRSLIYKANIRFLRDYEPEAALEILDKAVERAGNDMEKAVALTLKANVLKTQFLLEEALKVLDEAIALSPPQGQQEALLQKLEIYKELTAWEKAEETAERIKQLPITPPVKASLGDLYVKTKRYQEAVAFLRESIAGGIKSPANFVNLGTALSFMDKFEDVIAYLTPAVEELKMEDPELFRLLGGALVAQKDYGKGMELLKQYLILTGPNAWVKIQIAECQVGLKNYVEAIDILDKLEANVSLPELMPLIDHLQARILLENEEGRDPVKALEEVQKAIEGFKTAYTDFPDGNPEFLLTLAEAYKALGDMEKAKKTARDAAEKFPYHRKLEKFVDSLEE